MMHVCLAEFLKRPLPFPGSTNGIGSCYCTEMSTFKDQYLVWQLPGVVLKDDSHICWSWNTQTERVQLCWNVLRYLRGCVIFFFSKSGLDKFNVLNEIYL